MCSALFCMDYPYALCFTTYHIRTFTPMTSNEPSKTRKTASALPASHSTQFLGPITTFSGFITIPPLPVRCRLVSLVVFEHIGAQTQEWLNLSEPRAFVRHKWCCCLTTSNDTTFQRKIMIVTGEKGVKPAKNARKMLEIVCLSIVRFPSFFSWFLTSPPSRPTDTTVSVSLRCDRGCCRRSPWPSSLHTSLIHIFHGGRSVWAV